MREVTWIIIKEQHQRYTLNVNALKDLLLLHHKRFYIVPLPSRSSFPHLSLKSALRAQLERILMLWFDPRLPVIPSAPFSSSLLWPKRRIRSAPLVPPRANVDSVCVPAKRTTSSNAIRLILLLSWRVFFNVLISIAEVWTSNSPKMARDSCSCLLVF